MREECIPLSAPEAWREALIGIPHAFGHTWENCHAMHLTTGYTTFLYLLELNNIRVVCPIAERSYAGQIDIVTPYGFSGFAGNGSLPEFSLYWREFAAKKGYVCGYIGLNPILHDPSYYDSNDCYSYNCLFALDTTLSIENLFQQLSSNRKRQIRNSKATSFVFDKKKLLDFLLENYLDFFRSRKASEVYRFAPDTLIALSNQPNVILVGTEGDTGLNSVMMFAFSHRIGEYFLNVSTAEGQKNSAALIWKGVEEAVTRKCHWLNLGGGIQPEDGVAQFKERFGCVRFPLLALKQVYNEALFLRLCDNAEVDHSDRDGFFPPYREKLRR